MRLRLYISYKSLGVSDVRKCVEMPHAVHFHVSSTLIGREQGPILSESSKHRRNRFLIGQDGSATANVLHLRQSHPRVAHEQACYCLRSSVDPASDRADPISVPQDWGTSAARRRRNPARRRRWTISSDSFKMRATSLYEHRP